MEAPVFLIQGKHVSELQRSYWEICSLLWGRWGFFTCHTSAAGWLGQNSPRFALTFTTEHPFQGSRRFNFVLPLAAGLAQATPCIVCLMWKQTDSWKQAQRGDCGACRMVMLLSLLSTVPISASLPRPGKREQPRWWSLPVLQLLKTLSVRIDLEGHTCRCDGSSYQGWNLLPPKIGVKFAMNSSCTLRLPSSLTDSTGEVSENVEHMVKWS